MAPSLLGRAGAGSAIGHHGRCKPAIGARRSSRHVPTHYQAGAPVSRGQARHALRQEDIDMLAEAAKDMTPEEQEELRLLLEENQRLRQAVARNAAHMSAAQLARFSQEYEAIQGQARQGASGMARGGEGSAQQLAAAAGVSAPSVRVVQQTMSADSSGRPAASTSRTSVLVAEPPAAPPPPPPAPAAAAPPPPPANGAANGHSSGTANGAAPPVNDMMFADDQVSGRAYARDMASLSVELDATIDEDSDDDEEPEAQEAFPSAPAGEVNDVTFKFERPAQAPALSAVAAVASVPVPPPSPVPVQAAEAIGLFDEDPSLLQPEVPLFDAELLRAEAMAEVEGHSPKAVIEGRERWMIVTVPEKPVAGADVVVYFNRQQSEALRVRPRIVMQYAFNHWELVPEGNNKVDLMPSSAVPKGEGTDFWSVRVKVPKDTYEMNFIFSDNEQLYENNNFQDFCYPVIGGITVERWADIAAEMARQAELAKQAAARKAAEEEERKRAEQARLEAMEASKRKAEELRTSRGRLQANTLSRMTVEGQGGTQRVVYEVSPAEPEAGSKLTLRYNRSPTCIGRINVPAEQALTLLYGFNGWQQSGKVLMKRVPPKPKPAAAEPAAAEKGAAPPPAQPPPAEEDWWEVELEVPFDAVVMEFVANFYEHYDNNGRKDYKVPIALPAGLTVDLWADQVADILRAQEEIKRAAEEAAAREKAIRRDAEKRAAQELVRAVERRKVRHVLFTEPEDVTAGENVTVFYNPEDTLLAGKKQVFLIGGWNRWTHKKPFGPIRMQPPTDGERHWQATVRVPHDAFKMDFVFADTEGGAGTYDNRGGLDYHLPVEGSVVSEPSLYVCHISVEMAPIAKVGGLGDVVTALGRAVKEQGHVVEVILPRYDFFLHSPALRNQLKYECEFDWGGTRIFVSTAMVENLRVFFIEPRNGFFATQTVYGRYDDEVRFDFFCKAALEFLLKTGRQPDILHCHDWSTAHVAKSYWEDYHPYGLWKPRVVFTIHNLNYGQKKISEAAVACQKFTTVSPTYAFEVGGHPVVSSHLHKFMGIRNGIDPELWSPEENEFLPVGYSAENCTDGKKAARQALRQRVNLNGWGDKFIVAVVSRLTGQKGVPLIKHAAYRTIERGGQFVLLGSAPDPKVQAEFDALASSMGGQDAAFQFKYDEPLSHLIYAGADMIVVPSMFEPCGLTQMIAMRYGTVPIVRHTGGLRDTVFDVDFDKERAAWELYGSSDWQRDGLDATNGFAFTGTDTAALDYAMNRAIDAWYNDRAWFQGLQKRIMQQDWSWNRPAIDYVELYYAALK